MKSFTGAKGGAGIAEWIISQMPPHSVYVEPFLGTGAVMRRKAPARISIGIEADPKVIADYGAGVIASCDCEGLEIRQGSYEVLPALKLPADALVYCDPPYLGQVRSQVNRVYYGRELLTEVEHKQLLELLLGLRCQVMISGYWSQLYASLLESWRTSSKWTVNRAGHRAQEWLWMNFPQPILLHDTRFVGSDFTDRQRIKRKVTRWQKRFSSMGPPERAAVWEALRSTIASADSGGLNRRA